MLSERSFLNICAFQITDSNNHDCHGVDMYATAIHVHYYEKYKFHGVVPDPLLKKRELSVLGVL